MADPTPPLPLYHVLLIGICDYPGYNSLSGCVNDIDAIEQLLLAPPGIDIPADRIRITRLAAPRPGAQSTSRFQAQTWYPSKENVVAALTALAGPEVQETDRVLICYSGHGDFQQKEGAPTHEMLALNDGKQIQYLWDFEFNRYLAAIAARTKDLSCILDCCHSEGAIKAIRPGNAEGAERFLQRTEGAEPEPEPDAPGFAPADPNAPAGMLGALDPSYLTVVACQAYERAHEGPYVPPRPHGALTQSLLQLLGPMPADRRAQVRWADIFPQLVDEVGKVCASKNQTSQQPAVLGRPERRVFGGPWERQDPGFSLKRLDNGQYAIGTGTLLGVTNGAELAVYGPKPPEFPLLNSPADLTARIGMLKVVSAERAQCTAKAMAGDFDPAGARARLVKPGESERLRVLLDSPDDKLQKCLEESDLLSIVPPGTLGPEARISPAARGGWRIVTDTTDSLATVPPDEQDALRAGLESYHAFMCAVRMAKNSNDVQLKNVLKMRLLDCNDKDKLQGIDRQNPVLPEATSAGRGIYRASPGYRFCIEVTSDCRNVDPSVMTQNLHVTVLDCTAGGAVQYLGNTPLIWDKTETRGDRQVIWQRGTIGRPFVANPDPGFEQGGTDRIVAIATTRDDVDLHLLEVRRTVQEVIDAIVGAKGALDKEPEETKEPLKELWTSTQVFLQIG